MPETPFTSDFFQSRKPINFFFCLSPLWVDYLSLATKNALTHKMTFYKVSSNTVCLWFDDFFSKGLVFLKSLKFNNLLNWGEVRKQAEWNSWVSISTSKIALHILPKSHVLILCWVCDSICLIWNWHKQYNFLCCQPSFHIGLFHLFVFIKSLSLALKNK